MKSSMVEVDGMAPKKADDHWIQSEDAKQVVFTP